MIPGGSRDQRRLSQEVNSVHSAVYYLSHQKAELHRKKFGNLWRWIFDTQGVALG
jgi:hypothetical protein